MVNESTLPIPHALVDTGQERTSPVTEEKREFRPPSHIDQKMERLDRHINGPEKVIVNALIQGHPLSERELAFISTEQEQATAAKQTLTREFTEAEKVLEHEATLAEQVTAKRIGAVVSDSESLKSVASNLLSRRDNTDLYYVSKAGSPLLREAVATVGESTDVVGFEVQRPQAEQEHMQVTLVIQDEGKLKRVTVPVTDQSVIDAKFVFAAEGDIAGHAKRANEVAQAMVRLGYGGDIYWVASGKYAGVEDNEHNIKHVNLHNEPHGHANEAIINALEGKGDMHIWKPEKVQERAEQYQAAFTQILGEIGQTNAVLVSDFAPVADIVWQQLQREHGRSNDTLLTETHDTSMPPTRVIRNFKLFGAPLGEAVHTMTNNRVMERMDPGKKLYQVVNAQVNRQIDQYLGSPLHALRQELGIDVQRGPSFRGEMKGVHGSIGFGIDGTGEWNVGLLAEGAKSQEQTALVNEIVTASHGRPVIYHNEGSTYDRDAFFSATATLASMPDIYAVNATGSKHDTPEFSSRGLAIGQRNDRYMTLGYAPGYDIVRDANAKVVINQGGWGTISQSIQATVDRMAATVNTVLSEAQNKAPDLARINELLEEHQGPLRMIAIPRTWEQENNARALQERGAFCEVVLPADFRSAKRRHVFADAVRNAIEKPVSDKEWTFWADTYLQSKQSAPALHAAMIIERQGLQRQ